LNKEGIWFIFVNQVNGQNPSDKIIKP